MVSFPRPFETSRLPPCQRVRTARIDSHKTTLLIKKFCGWSTKSFTFHPAPKLISTRPFDKLSTTAQSSATLRAEACCGMLTLPARKRICDVSLATVAASKLGFGNEPPKASKCLSGSQTAFKPLLSAIKHESTTRSYTELAS